GSLLSRASHSWTRFSRASPAAAAASSAPSTRSASVRRRIPSLPESYTGDGSRHHAHPPLSPHVQERPKVLSARSAFSGYSVGRLARPQANNQSGVRPEQAREGREKRVASPAKTRSLQVRLALLVVLITSPA